MEGWIIVSDKGNAMFYTLERERLNCIARFLLFNARNWKHYYNKGYRCKRVVLKFD